jgi:hypothetical protein
LSQPTLQRHGATAEYFCGLYSLSVSAVPKDLA